MVAYRNHLENLNHLLSDFLVSVGNQPDLKLWLSKVSTAGRKMRRKTRK